MRNRFWVATGVRKDASLRVFIGDKRTKSGEDCESALRRSPGGTEHHTEDGGKVCEVRMRVQAMFDENTSACAVVRWERVRRWS